MAFPTTSYKTVVLPCGRVIVKTWIAIKLVDENDKPIANAKYVIIFPDGTRDEGDLDGDGYKYFDNIPPGECAVGFPGISPFWSFNSTITASKRTDPTWAGWSDSIGSGPGSIPPVVQPPQSIDVDLLDENGLAVPDEKFQIALPNGDIAQGFLDAHGHAHITGITPGGECKIRFPGIDDAFLEFDKSQ